MKNAIAKACFGFLSLLLVSPAYADSVGYAVVDGKFRTLEGDVPSGCIGQLMTEINGDNAVAAVYLNRLDNRGCIAANFPYPGGDESQISYDIVEELGGGSYNIEVCKSMDGSMGQHCDRITVQFNYRQYITPDVASTILSLEKVGEW